MIYDYKCDDCEETFTVHCRMEQRHDVRTCPSCNSVKNTLVILGAPALGDSVRLGVRKVDDGFREVLSKVKERNYKSNIGDKLSR